MFHLAQFSSLWDQMYVGMYVSAPTSNAVYHVTPYHQLLTFLLDKVSGSHSRDVNVGLLSSNAVWISR
jgi:hypothetical protein